MALKAADLLKVIGAAGGGSNQVQASAAAIKLRQNLNVEAAKIGKFLAPFTGDVLLKSVADGAAAEDSKLTEKFIQDNAGFSLSNLTGWATMAAILGLAWFIFRGK